MDKDEIVNLLVSYLVKVDIDKDLQQVIFDAEDIVSGISAIAREQVKQSIVHSLR